MTSFLYSESFMPNRPADPRWNIRAHLPVDDPENDPQRSPPVPPRPDDEPPPLPEGDPPAKAPPQRVAAAVGFDLS